MELDFDIMDFEYVDFKSKSGYCPRIEEDIAKIVNEFILPFSIKKPKENPTHQLIYDMLHRWDEDHRYFHTQYHLNEILYLIKKLKGIVPDATITDLTAIAYFHDAIYDPKATDNEENSALFFKKFIEDETQLAWSKHPELERLNTIFHAIIDTKTHYPQSELSRIFCALDMYPISHYPFEKLLEYEHQIFKEYQFVDYSTYKETRIKVLQQFNKEYQRKELEHLIEYVKFRIPKVGIYTGSFKPFHNGHMNILKKAEKMFDKVIVARGINPEKNENSVFQTDLEKVLPYHETEEFAGYLHNYIKSKYKTGILPVIIKGLRNESDFKNELKQDIYTKQLSHVPSSINTVCIFSDIEFSHISSTDIRMMEKIEIDSAKNLYFK